MGLHSRRTTPLCLSALLLSLWMIAPPPLARAQAPPAGPSKEQREAQAILKAFEESYPDRPEWLDMLADIMTGPNLGPHDGWFRRAPAQTRFDWKSTAKAFDRDHDGSVTRAEFGGSDPDFARLDRDRDAAVTEADFDFSTHALAPSPGRSLFAQLDLDGNGKVTREEFDGLFGKLDAGGQGFLSLSDIQDALPTPKMPAGSAPAPGGPRKDTLIRALFKQELGSLQAGPNLDESAPDFTLKTNDGSQEIRLSKLVGPKPVVLIFGTFTCGPFRSHSGNIEKLSRLYKDRATFLMVYVREAHPTDGWRSESNDRVRVALTQPTTYDERVKVARTCGAHLKLGIPMVVDTIDDAVGARYSGMPSRLYLIDRAGKVAYKSGRGPYGFKPNELEHSLVLLLRSEGGAETSREASR